MPNALLDRRVIFVLGKGGVGKTTLSAALAMVAASGGARTLVMETDVRAPMALALGVKPSFEPVEAAPNLFTMVLEGSHALEEYLGLVVPGRAVLKTVFASRLYQFFVQTAPGLRELMMLGKVYYEAERKEAKHKAPARDHWDMIVVDSPASGQALALLGMPTAARSTFGSSIVGNEADNIARMLRDRRRCAIVEVTTADSLAVSEVLETHAALLKMDLEPAALFFNRIVTAHFREADTAILARRGELRHGGHLAEIARAEIARDSSSRDALERIRAAIHEPIIEVPDCAGLSGGALIRELASLIAPRLASTTIRHSARR